MKRNCCNFDLWTSLNSVVPFFARVPNMHRYSYCALESKFGLALGARLLGFFRLPTLWSGLESYIVPPCRFAEWNGFVVPTQFYPYHGVSMEYPRDFPPTLNTSSFSYSVSVTQTCNSVTGANCVIRQIQILSLHLALHLKSKRIIIA